MTDNTSNNKRIAKNTLMLYIRMLGMTIIAFYTSRVILQVLGVEDFGINNVVAGFVSMLAFFTGSLSNASQRYLSIGLGEKNIEETTSTFRQSFTLMLVFSMLVLVLGETVGLWFVCNKLVIPPSRLNAALWIYQFALVSTICSINQVTFMAAIVAREKMGVYAYLGIFEAVARLIIVLILQRFSNVDHLILFGFLSALVSMLTFLCYVLYCILKFPEAKCKIKWNNRLVKDMSGFIGANLFGCFAWAAGLQGINIILNMFFGPIVNTARGIAIQVNGIVARFTESLMTAMKPQIFKSYACGDLIYMRVLIEKSSKYMSFLVSFLSIPIMFETEYLLNLWLGQVPMYSVDFVRLVLIDQMIYIYTPPLWIAANATGKIMRTQVWGRILSLLALPISYLILLKYSNPLIPMIILIVAEFGYWLYCLFDIKSQLNLNLLMYCKRVVSPTIIFMLMIAIINYAITKIYPVNDLYRFLMVCFSTVVIGGICCYVLSDCEEKKVIHNMVKKYL